MKTLVIGLDGATFKALDPLMEHGYMPNLRDAVARGARGVLLSTIPPVTALAWPSFMTGKNAGKHGLFGWQTRLNASFQRPWVSGRRIHGSKLWHLVNREGMRACVVNVPVTYPPEPLDGVMVTGMLTPGLNVEFTYPAELQAQLLAAVPDYRIDVDVQHTERDGTGLDGLRSFLDEATAATQARGRAFRWLLEREQPDLAMVVFEMPDRLQHVLWRYVESLPQLPAGIEANAPTRDALLDCFRTLDGEIGHLVGKVGPDAYLVFVSDHGFGRLETLVQLNEWLHQRGWLAYDRGRAALHDTLRAVGRRVKSLLPPSLTRKARETLRASYALDWEHTQAYAGLPSEYGVFLNVRGREPAGVVSLDEYDTLRTEIMDALREWIDPQTGLPLMKAVYRREEIYHGPFVVDAPDIIFEFQKGYKVSHFPSQKGLLMDVSHELRGFHEREGVFAMSGPGVLPGLDAGTVAIEDVMPTILYALRLPVPDDVDGIVLQDLFSPLWRASYPVRRQPAAEETATPEPHPYSAEDEQQIAEHLKALGYLE